MQNTDSSTREMSTSAKAVVAVVSIMLNILAAIGLTALMGKLLVVMGAKFSYPVGVGTSVVLRVLFDLITIPTVLRFPIKSPDGQRLKLQRLKVTFLLILPLGIVIGTIFGYY